MSDGVSSFLFQGQAPVPQPTGSDTTTSFPLWMQSGIYNLAGSAFNLAGQPYTPYGGQLTATPSGQTQEAWNLAGQNVGDWQPFVNQGGALTAAAGTPINSADINTYYGNYAPNVAGGGGALTGAYNNSVTGAIPGYQNPYNEDVVQGLIGASNYNLENNVLPQVQSEFVSAGQGASPQQRQATNNAIYNSETALNPALSQALQTGYGQSLSAAEQGASTGYGLANTGYGGALTTALGEQQAQQTAGAQMGQLGALTSQLGSYDVANLASAGSAQDTLAQQNLNTQYQQFENQLQWPYQNLQFASGILRGAQGLIPTTSQGVGTTYPPAYGASPLTTALGTAALAGSVGIKHGGHISRRRLTGYADGGSVDNDNYAGDPSSLVYGAARALEFANHPPGWGGGTEKSSLPPLSERMRHWDEVDAEREAAKDQKSASASSTATPGYASGGGTSDIISQVLGQEAAMTMDPAASALQSTGATTYYTPSSPTVGSGGASGTTYASTSAPQVTTSVPRAPIEQFNAGSGAPSTGTPQPSPLAGLGSTFGTQEPSPYTGQFVASQYGQGNQVELPNGYTNGLISYDPSTGLLDPSFVAALGFGNTPMTIQQFQSYWNTPSASNGNYGAARGGHINRRRIGALKHFAVGGPARMQPGGGVMAPMASPMVGALGMRRAA